MNYALRILTIFLTSVLIGAGCTKETSKTEENSSVMSRNNIKLSKKDLLTELDKERKKIISERNLSLEDYGREDPFSPIGTKSSGISDERGSLYLEGIIEGEDNPLAIINSDIVKEGDEINGEKILKINKDNVIIEGKNGKEYKLGLF